jgi:hypothetical protein
MATADKNTIGVTPKAQKILDQMSEGGAFADQMDAAKFAISIAIRRGAKPGEVTGAGTKWNVGSFDTDKQLSNLISIIFPNITTQYRAIESLIDSGLAIIARDYVRADHFDLANVLRGLEAQKMRRSSESHRSDQRTTKVR